jgi:prepilin-type N-terminal cleavage/methylation domain-containing protein
MKHRESKSAFTLLEMLVVMALMLLILGVGLVNFNGIGSSAALNGLLNEMQSITTYARQQAILHNTPVNIYFHKSNPESISTDEAKYLYKDDSGGIIYEIWAMTNGYDVTYNQLSDELIIKAKKDEQDQNYDIPYGYQFGTKNRISAGLDLSVNASSSVDFEFSKDQTKSTYMTILPSGSSPSANTDGTITLRISPADVDDVGYKIKIFSITGLTKVEELP